MLKRIIIFAFIFLSFFGEATGVIISVVVLCIFGKGYYDMMKEFKPKAYEREVKEIVKGYGNFRGLKF